MLRTAVIAASPPRRRGAPSYARRGARAAAPRSTRCATSGTRSLARGPADAPFSRHEWISRLARRVRARARCTSLVARDAAGAPPGSRRSSERTPRRRPPRRARRTTTPAAWSGRSARSLAARWPRSGRTCATACAGTSSLLRDLPRDGPTSTLLEPLARADRHLTGRWESQRSPYVPLAGGAPAEERTSSRSSARTSAGALEAARRAGRRRAASASTARDGLDAALGEFLALEAAGWKGQRRHRDRARPRGSSRSTRAIARDGGGARRARASARSRSTGAPSRCTSGSSTAAPTTCRRPPTTRRSRASRPGSSCSARCSPSARRAASRGSTSSGPTCPGSATGSPAHAPHDWLYVYRPSFAGARHAHVEAPAAPGREGGARVVAMTRPSRCAPGRSRASRRAALDPGAPDALAGHALAPGGRPAARRSRSARRARRATTSRGTPSSTARGSSASQGARGARARPTTTASRWARSRRRGAIPRFVRVDGRMRLDLEDLERRRSARARARCTSSTTPASPQPMDDVLALARRHGLPVIEDCALVAPRRARGRAARLDRRRSASSASTRRCRCRTAARSS